jgi:hypothetical protein
MRTNQTCPKYVKEERVVPKCRNCGSTLHNISKCQEVCGHCKGKGHIKNTCMIDRYTKEVLISRFHTYIKRHNEDLAFNAEHAVRIRSANPPEDITENIVKEVLNRLGQQCVWCKGVGADLSGDLYETVKGLVKEVKAFTSDGPSSFGPKKIFDLMYFLDLRRIFDPVNPILVLWEVNLSNRSEAWKSIQMNSDESFENKTTNGNRPHIAWESIKAQIDESSPGTIKMLYEGSFEDIFTKPEPATAPVSLQ